MDLTNYGLKPFLKHLQVGCIMYFIIVTESWKIEHFPVYLTKSSLFLLHGYLLGFPSHLYDSPVYSPSRQGPGMERMLNNCWLLICYTLILLKWILPFSRIKHLMQCWTSIVQHSTRHVASNQLRQVRTQSQSQESRGIHPRPSKSY